MISKKFFNIISYVIVSFLLILSAPFAYAYGGSSVGTSTNCTAARISEENPTPEAKITKLSDFSFVASPNTNPLAIRVEIRDQKGKFKVTEQPDGSLLVEGKIPEPITEEKYARVDIFVSTMSGCSSHYHYLVKITGEGQQEGEKASSKGQGEKSERYTNAHKRHEESTY